MTSLPPPRYDCLLCGHEEFGERFLTKPELNEHVESDHDPSDALNSLFPVNLPLVATVPDATTEREARVAINRDDEEQVTPPITQAVTDGKCPIEACDHVADPKSIPVMRALGNHVDATHDTWEIYSYLRNIVPNEYEYSPTYDDAGYPDPAGTVMQLQPGDRVTITGDGWAQSLGTPRGQTRDSVSQDEEVQVFGIVERIEDDQDDFLRMDTFGGIHREVTLIAKSTLFDDTTEVFLQPKEDGDVTMKFPPVILQPNASQRKGHGSPGYVTSKISTIERTPWHQVED